MDQKELLRTIARAAEEGWTKLNLSNQGLTELPPEIGNLTNLTQLDLSCNQLNTLPSEFGKLIKLTSWLDLSGNQFINFPLVITVLKDLKGLAINDNQLTVIPPEIGEMIGLTRLFISNNQLIMLPTELGKLINLVRLSLINNQLTSLPHKISNLTNLTRLNLGDNQLTSLPNELCELTKLTELNLKNNRLNRLPYEINKLTNLKELNLKDNFLPIPSEILLLTRAPDKIIKYYLSLDEETRANHELTIKPERKSVDLSNKQLITISNEIEELKDLIKLDLRNNQLSDLPSSILSLTSLTELNLNGNKLSTLSPEISKLTNLASLYLSSNQITCLPTEIKYLVNLKSLNINNNKFTTIPSEIWKLQKLITFSATNNQIFSISSEIRKLSNLTRLYLRNNKIASLPSEIGELTNLLRLDLADNQINSFPLEIQNLKNLVELDLQGNPLPVPLEILALRDEPAKILNYYFQKGQKKPLNEVKVLIVGQGAVGKTSLIKRLLEDTFDPHETKTDGIAINHWHLNIDGSQIRLNVWDFGGQEIMHATHQFFLTKRSLYVLVLDSRLSEQENRLEYWLKIIQSFGGDSPVIVVCNKNDQHDLDLDWKGLQNKYPSIKAFAKTISCKTGDGIPQLKTQIEREVAQLEHLHDELILPWFAVKTQLEEMQRDYISYGDYQQMCQQADVSDELSQQTLLGFLHDLGIVLHFHDHPLLEDTNVLNPAWVTRGVYQLLNSNELFQRKGELDHKALERILDPHTYPRNKHPFIIDMMRKFELCFDFAEFSGERFLVPDLLAKEEPYTGEWADSLAFQYHYDILPGSVLSRFMVRMHAYIHQRTYWRNGVVLISEDGKNRALVKADIEDKTIFIFVSGKPETRHLFLELIRADFRKIHKTIPKLAVTEVVPLPGKPEVLIDYTDLLKLRERGIKTYYYPKADSEINVDQLLDGLEPGKGQSLLSAGLQRDIVAFLASIPGIQDRSAQHALIYSAGLDAQLQQRINFSGATAQFFELLVPLLNGYGRLADGQLALIAVLQAAKEQVGHDRQTYCETLIHAVQREFAE